MRGAVANIKCRDATDATDATDAARPHSACLSLAAELLVGLYNCLDWSEH